MANRSKISRTCWGESEKPQRVRAKHGAKSFVDTDKGVRYPALPHAEINAHDIDAICHGDQDAIDHAEECHRLSVIEQLRMFAPAISGPLIKVFQHSDAIGDGNEAITSRLIAKAEGLKGKVVKADPFVDRAMISVFADECTEMQIPDTNEFGVTR